MKQLSKADLDALPWGSVVCEADLTLHVKLGQDGYEYWAEPGVEGPTYPHAYGVTLWSTRKEDK